MIEREKAIRIVASRVDADLKEIYGARMGFFLCVAPYDKTDQPADYISSTTRETGIQWLRETADILEKNMDIPFTQGNA